MCHVRTALYNCGHQRPVLDKHCQSALRFGDVTPKRIPQQCLSGYTNVGFFHADQECGRSRKQWGCRQLQGLQPLWTERDAMKQQIDRLQNRVDLVITAASQCTGNSTLLTGTKYDVQKSKDIAADVLMNKLPLARRDFRYMKDETVHGFNAYFMMCEGYITAQINTRDQSWADVGPWGEEVGKSVAAQYRAAFDDGIYQILRSAALDVEGLAQEAFLERGGWKWPLDDMEACRTLECRALKINASDAGPRGLNSGNELGSLMADMTINQDKVPEFPGDKRK